MIIKFDTECEAQAKGNENDKPTLEEISKQGKYPTKKQDKLCITAAKQADKARLTAEKKAKVAEIRAGKKQKTSSQGVKDLHEGHIRLPPPPPAVSSTGLQIPIQDKTAEQPGNDDDDDDDDDVDMKLFPLVILFGSLYGSSVIKPNHHYATHVGDRVRSIGPLHNFWTFFEKRIPEGISHRVPDLPPYEGAEIMSKATNEKCGTVAGLAVLSPELDNVSTEFS
ncbi:hypothetical protein F4604DRAFT_1679619 [Suillus subluteus]|nr:hypothetical protein F4604DRAFT_1679619 [Suillus subluteus]